MGKVEPRVTVLKGLILVSSPSGMRYVRQIKTYNVFFRIPAIKVNEELSMLTGDYFRSVPEAPSIFGVDMVLSPEGELRLQFKLF